MMPETIAGADGSEHSRRALKWATSEAEASHARSPSSACITGERLLTRRAIWISVLALVNEDEVPVPPDQGCQGGRRWPGWLAWPASSC